ncbi:hypothetical protein MNBD_ALPHA12-225 [hydrothermal vent metagenome]|uniref:Uncharacterized protein n=1 Tax=hydrothermal vent metagenome TaxID=652676 RepID=A0A3B0UDU0_9ZZZZ
MLLLRSIFWLTAAYLIIGPNVTIPESMNQLSNQTLQGAKQVVAGQLDNINCTSLQCSGAKAVIAASLSAKSNPRAGNNAPNNGNPAPKPIYEQTDSTIPIPRPRLVRTG